MQQGLLGRISRCGIMEYHAFGIISEGKNSPYHYMICGVQGDFTKSLVQTPPKTIWTRELKVRRLIASHVAGTDRTSPILSLPVCLTQVRYIREVSEFVLARV